MLIEESIAVEPSVDNGGASVMEDTPVTPSEQPAAPEAPAEEKKEEVAVVVDPPTTPEPELFELPDGRKVDAATLSKEWKENFLPEFTRKSQALAAKEEPIINKKPVNPLEDPNYVPASIPELAAKIKEETIREIEGKQQAKVEQQKAVETAIENELSEIRKADPQFNENALFVHANKYGFRSLKAAHQNMTDMRELAKNVQETTTKNINKRTDPVSIKPGATGGQPSPSQFSSSQEYLAAVKASGKV